MATTYTEVAVTDSAAVSPAVLETTRNVKIQPSVPVRVRFDGTNPTTSTGIRVPADAILALDETEGDGAKFISESGSGVLRVTCYNA